MLVLNCSRAFADFIQPNTKAGKPPLVLVPPAKAVSDDSQWLCDQNGQPPAALWQWQLHMVVVRRTPCVLVMEVDTRFCMLFTDLRKGDIAELLKQMLERLLNLQLFAVGDMGQVEDADLDGITDRLFARHRDFRLVLRGNRSVQTHLNDVAYHLDMQVDKRNGLPHGHERCAVFDDICNGLLRRSQSRPDWFFPAEEMLCNFMREFAGWTPDGIVRLREQLKLRRRQAWNEQSMMGNTGAIDNG